jgi:hypothetical protein
MFRNIDASLITSQRERGVQIALSTSEERDFTGEEVNLKLAALMDGILSQMPVARQAQTLAALTLATHLRLQEEYPGSSILFRTAGILAKDAELLLNINRNR